MTENTTTSTTRDPAEIERDIRQTQDEMSRTVDRIGDQMTARNIVNALLDKADSNNVDARMVLDGARRNPLALGLIAAGAIWLVSDTDAKLPSKMPSLGGGKKPKQADPSDMHHRDYLAHMEKVEWREGEDPLAYQRRRDIARANYFMVERNHDEEESAWRQRLDQASEKLRERRHAWAEQGSRAVGSTRDTARSAASAASEQARNVANRASDAFTRNPLIGGLAAAALGAIVGTLVPITEAEEEKLSDLGQKARDVASEQKDKLTEVARDKKDQLVQKAEAAAQPSQQTSHANDAQQPEFQQAASQPATQQPTGSNDASNAQQGVPKQYT